MPTLCSDNLSDPISVILQGLQDSKLSNDFQPDESEFLMKFLQTESFGKLLQVHALLEEKLMRPEKQDNIILCKQILTIFDTISGGDADVKELTKILDQPDLRSLIEAHDNVLYQTYATPLPSPSISPAHQSSRRRAEPIRVIGLHKTCSEPLGITLSVDKFGSVYIARILRGSMIDRQGLLHVGDVIKEINGKPVSGSPDAVHNELKNHVGSISLKLYPSYKDTSGVCQIFVKAHFDYDASRDQHIPCGEAGLSFRKGDILEVVEQSDPNWWQARAVDGSGQAGIIPSQMLEENRRTSISSSHRESRVQICGTTRTKKRKVIYSSAKNAVFDRLDIPVYEEVAHMPPFLRKTLILIGAPGVGRRTLKNRLIVEDPTRFGSTIPHTSRPSRAGEESGRGYYFVSRAQMLREIEDGQFLEWGEFERHLYGTKIETVRNVMRSGKMCILDVNPTALKILKTAEFMPLVVFIAAPSADVLRETNRKKSMGKAFVETELQETVEENRHLSELYSHYFDLTLVNEDVDLTLDHLKSAIEALNTQTQWVPVNWVY